MRDPSAVRAEGIEVDDDNEPVPENVPIRGAAAASVFKDWDFYSGVCPRRAEGLDNVGCKISVPIDVKPSNLFCSSYFFSSHSWKK